MTKSWIKNYKVKENKIAKAQELKSSTAQQYDLCSKEVPPGI